MTTRLVLLRHAKSSWSDPDLPDHDRPLNGRGRRAARLVGGHLRDIGFEPDLVLCSSARRTVETLDLVDLPSSTNVLVEDAIYGAGAAELLARLRAVDARVGSVLLVAHNPSLEDLTARLVRDRASVPARFPTAALADLRLPTTWNELEPASARLESFVVPRDLQ